MQRRFSELGAIILASRVRGQKRAHPEDSGKYIYHTFSIWDVDIPNLAEIHVFF